MLIGIYVITAPVPPHVWCSSTEAGALSGPLFAKCHPGWSRGGSQVCRAELPMPLTITLSSNRDVHVSPSLALVLLVMVASSGEDGRNESSQV